MTPLRIVINIVYIIVCVVLSILILSQEGKMRGLGAISGTPVSDSYWGKAKSRSKEGRIKRLTYILAVVFFVLSVALSMHPIH